MLRDLLTPGGRALVAAALALADELGGGRYDDGVALAVGTRLRRDRPDQPAATVAAATAQVRLRLRAARRLGPLARHLWLTPDGAEQASAAAIAAGHARRYADAGARTVVDLGCGVGSDLLALRTAGLAVLGIERDPETALAAAANLGAGSGGAVVRADATTWPFSGADAAFVDPARRLDGHRVRSPDAWSPSLAFVLELARRLSATGAKLGPGVGHDLLPATAEAEWVSLRGEVKECALWCGPLASGARHRATLLPSGATLTGDPSRRADAGPLGRWLYECDGAVVRAGLVAEVAERVGGTLVDPGIAYVTSDRYAGTPFAAAHEVLEVLPVDGRRLRAAVRAHAAAAVTVMKRASPVDTAALARTLTAAARTDGGPHLVVALTRHAGRPVALLTRPVAAPAPLPSP